MKIYDLNALEELAKSQDLTIQERIDAVCATLRISKAMCENLMKGERLEAEVGNPKQTMGALYQNAKQNSTRKMQI